MSDALSYDDLVIGSGMAGLAFAARAAHAGRRVVVLEAHDSPGGYAHSFRMNDYRFCAQVHYIFGCGEGETIDRLLTTLGVRQEVPFLRLDPDGFDHVVVAGERFRIPSGMGAFEERLVRRFPEAKRALRGYFDAITTIGRELDALDVPDTLSLRALPSALVGAWRARHVARYLRWTLADLYDRVAMPPLLRAVLAGQCGDYLLPPRDVSLLLHVALVTAYDRGAYYPQHHYGHFVDTLVASITRHEGCAVLLEHEVDRIESDGRRALAVTTKNGKRFTAQRYVSNADPRLTARLAGLPPDAPSLRYEYSSGTFTVYLGVRGLDLREHGFGSFNVWHYPHADLDRIYDVQRLQHDLSDPWLFLSTPTLHSSEPGLCPPGDQILEVATSCDYERFARMRQNDRRAYNAEKKQIRDRIEAILEERYVPGLRKHIVMRVTGTPATNERFCRAPAGNSYGAALTPRHVNPAKRPQRTALANVWMANATAGFPSVSGALGAGVKLFEELEQR